MGEGPPGNEDKVRLRFSARRHKAAGSGVCSGQSAGGQGRGRVHKVGGAPLVGRVGRGGRAPTSHLLLQAQDDLHGLLQDEQLGLRLVRLEVQLAHAPQLPEGLVNVPHAHPLPRVIGHAPLPVPQVFLLQG